MKNKSLVVLTRMRKVAYNRYRKSTNVSIRVHTFVQGGLWTMGRSTFVTGVQKRIFVYIYEICTATKRHTQQSSSSLHLQTYLTSLYNVFHTTPTLLQLVGYYHL